MPYNEDSRYSPFLNDEYRFDENGYCVCEYPGSCGYDHEPPDDNDGECNCQFCRRTSALNYDNSLESYGYKPEPVFYGEGPLYYGMEVEITAPTSAISKAKRLAGPVAYFKSDCSVRGFEMVTHPMSFDWAMENFPWGMLPRLKDEGCRVIREDNGIHIHLSRAGFDNAAHQYKWMKLLYRNASHVQRIARRDGARWGSFNDPAHRDSQYFHVYKGKKGYSKTLPKPEFTFPQCGRCYACRNYATDPYYADRYGSGWWCETAMNTLSGERALRAFRREMSDWNYSSDVYRDRTGINRYSAINTQNAATYEVRVFASTLKVEYAQGALQLLHAAFEYARELDAHKVASTKGNAWGWPAFRGYFKNDGRFESLVYCDERLRTPR